MSENTMTDETAAELADIDRQQSRSPTTGVASRMRELGRRLPTPVKRALRQAYPAGRTAAYAPLATVELLALKRELRAMYGRELSFAVDDQDEMFQFMQEFWFWEHHVAPMPTRSYAMRTYLVSGHLMMRDLESILRDQGRPLSEVESFLEFAAGYGRFTRFLAARVGPERVTVSDISRPAVDFARRTYRVSGFYSAESADDVAHSEQHEIVFVASLFSHLTIAHWTAWLQRLYQMVAPGGLMIFSTHGPFVRDHIYDAAARAKLVTQADGFSYLLTNETHGRLPVDYYGSAFVTEDFVRSQIHQHALGNVSQVYRARLWGTQDVYVLEKPLPGS
jgi:2-polyprenyl-3-methyl-5-hydroxy-6-metoxy-1,4-benzoquinol methylase